MALRLVPNFLKPVIAPLLSLRSNMHFRICLEICGPVIGDRIRNTKAKLEDPSHTWEPLVRSDLIIFSLLLFRLSPIRTCFVSGK
jgi:hypothetical protein